MGGQTDDGYDAVVVVAAAEDVEIQSETLADHADVGLVYDGSLGAVAVVAFVANDVPNVVAFASAGGGQVDRAA